MLYNKDVDEKVAERYAKVSSALFDVLAQMKGSEVKVYLCICKYANFKNGICFPNISTICKVSGINRNLVCKALKQLCALALIRKRRASRSFKFKNVYTVLKNPDINFNACPPKMDKRKPRHRLENGRWAASPQYMDSDICPQKADSITYPQNMEGKQLEHSLNKYSNNRCVLCGS